MHTGHRLRFVVLVALVAAAFIVRLIVGPVMLPPIGVLQVLFGRADVAGMSADIVRDFRVPQALTAMAAGAALAVSGLQMQTLFGNPLAGPWALGLVAGAQLGVAALVVSGAVFGVELSGVLSPVSLSGVTTAAAGGALVVLLLAVPLSRRVGGLVLLVCGLIFTHVADGIRGVLLHLVSVKYELLFLSWNQGGFGGVTWPQLRVFWPAVAVGLAIAVALTKPLNALLLGERYARSLGLRLGLLRLASLTSTALLAGTATAFCGAVLFIDLAVPHLCRTIFRTADHRVLVPAAALTGALLALVADIGTGLPPGDEVVALNIMTSLIGGPVVLWVLWRGKVEEIRA